MQLLLPILGLSLVSGFAAARTFSPPLPLPKVVAPKDDFTPVHVLTGETLPPLNTTYFFDQLIDHNDTSKGTFQQRFWMTWEFYEEGEFVYLVWSTDLEGDTDS